MPATPSTGTASLHTALLEILRRHPAGLSEYELFSEMDKVGHTDYGKNAFSDEHTLLCRHFLLFNALYQLADNLHANREGHLEITPLSIRLHPYRVGQVAINPHDPLRTFYLDVRELEKFTADDVMQMLGSFWAGYHRYAGRSAALSVLGLEEPVSDDSIRKRYRQLAMQHHPDRGGDTTVFQELAAAMQILLPTAR